MMGGTSELTNLIRREVLRVLATQARPRVGMVTSYDPDLYAVKLMLKPEDVETGWIPLSTLHIGNGFGVAIGPEVGDQMEVAFQEGSMNSARILGRLFSDEEKPPRVEAGEALLRRKDGSRIFMDKQGHVRIASKGLVKINMG